VSSTTFLEFDQKCRQICTEEGEILIGSRSPEKQILGEDRTAHDGQLTARSEGKDLGTRLILELGSVC
jgi:hypothetical protein